MKHFPKISLFLTLAALLAVLMTHQVATLLFGMLAFSGVRVLMPLDRRFAKGHGYLAAGVFWLALIALIGFSVALASHFAQGLVGPGELMRRLAEALGGLKASLPQWLSNHLPVSADAARDQATQLLKAHASALSSAGVESLKSLSEVLLGMVTGTLIAVAGPPKPKGPLAVALLQRATNLYKAFVGVFGAQLKISAINTLATAIYLLGVLPLFGYHVPLAKTLVVVTFLVGMLPVVGNLISNTCIVLLSIGVSFWGGMASLAFLVGIHKVEYFLNARIVGTQIQATTWEILVVLLGMHALFGVPGMVMGPLVYAYLKRELAELGLI